jgi:hypothetical protein
MPDAANEPAQAAGDDGNEIPVYDHRRRVLLWDAGEEYRTRAGGAARGASRA